MLKNAIKILKELLKKRKEDSLLDPFENAWRVSFAFFCVSLYCIQYLCPCASLTNSMALQAPGDRDSAQLFSTSLLFPRTSTRSFSYTLLAEVEQGFELEQLQETKKNARDKGT